LVLDLKMPRKTGLEVLQWLQGEPLLKTIPVIVFSSSAQAEDVDRCYKYGANAFVVKPVSLEERAELARLIKGFWLGFNEPPAVCRGSAEFVPGLSL
jgi:CheY-like chemotaxis protein